MKLKKERIKMTETKSYEVRLKEVHLVYWRVDGLDKEDAIENAINGIGEQIGLGDYLETLEDGTTVKLRD
jgi:hypothetical protein